jgi:ribosomal protein S18 acetylase RimI-like enzyme
MGVTLPQCTASRNVTRCACVLPIVRARNALRCGYESTRAIATGSPSRQPICLGGISVCAPCENVRGAACWRFVIITPRLVYRTIDPEADASLLVRNQRDACVATFGDDLRYQGDQRYLAWLRDKVEEFPDGCVLAMLDDRCVGQLELQVPFGLAVGYINLFYVAPFFRGQGYGRALYAYAEKYFRAWEAKRVELHVSPTNERAIGFYRRMGFRFVRADEGGTALWLMAKSLY